MAGTGAADVRFHLGVRRIGAAGDVVHVRLEVGDALVDGGIGLGGRRLGGAGDQAGEPDHCDQEGEK